MGAELVDYEDDQVKKADVQLDIGFTTKALLAKLTDEAHMIKKFYDGVRSFYEKVCSYAKSALPLGDPLLKNARFLNILLGENQLIYLKLSTLLGDFHPFCHSVAIQQK